MLRPPASFRARAAKLVAQTGAQVRRFRRTQGGIAATEFALILPLMLLLMLGSVEAARLIIFSRRINLVANTAVQMLTQNTTGSVNYIDLHFAYDSTMVIFPQILQDAAQRSLTWSNDISMSLSSVIFTKKVSTCTVNCTYKANVVWNSGDNPRPCGVNLAAVADTTTPTPRKLPTDLYGPGSVIVVDIVFTYVPLFNLGIFGPIALARSAYVAPRYVPLIKYAVIPGDDGTGTECPGY